MRRLPPETQSTAFIERLPRGCQKRKAPDLSAGQGLGRCRFSLLPLDDTIRLIGDTEDHGTPIRTPVIHGFRFRWYPFDTQIKKTGPKGIVPCLPSRREKWASTGEKSKTPAEGKIHTVRASSTYILTRPLLDVNDLTMMIHEKQALHRPEATDGLSKLPLHNDIGQALHPPAVEDDAG